METELLDLFPHTVTIEPYSGQDQHGLATYGAAVSYTAQVGGRNRMVRDLHGQLVASTFRVILASAVAVTPKDRITLPSGYLPAQSPIVSVEKYVDDLGNHHTSLALA